ncbi:uncharacterized protein LOC111989011 isoform X3 [Quercus suber]|uniref:uncharacterized protein LOC111989011 isoform X3 n=1 Tax=Quercus suber TaxID=58331 RepID=UPI000CE19C07|nr:uncharacterized protein LOC111989011 isoform X7 [Quercus suber]
MIIHLLLTVSVFLSCTLGMSLRFSCSSTSFPQQHQVRGNLKSSKNLDKVRNLVKTVGVPSLTSSPLESLRKGNWVKLICGASFEDVVDIRNLSLVYTLAGVDCIDCAADLAVVSAVNDGIESARDIVGLRRPWVMISVNDDEDLHFRKAGLVTYIRDTTATADLIKRNGIDAVEIHTSGRQSAFFEELWDGLGDSISHLRLIAVSLPNVGDSTISSMNTMYSIMEPNLPCFNLWQLDGRPMSGDIGRGATRESIAFAVRMAAVKDRPPGFLQLAGGTNAHTVDGLKKMGLFQTTSITKNPKDEILTASLPNSLHALIGGIAYGGYARKIVGRVLSSMQSQYGVARIEDYPEHLLEALREALALVGTVKSYDPF